MFHQNSKLVTNIFKHLLCAESQQKETKPDKEGGDRGYSFNAEKLKGGDRYEQEGVEPKGYKGGQFQLQSAIVRGKHDSLPSLPNPLLTPVLL